SDRFRPPPAATVSSQYRITSVSQLLRYSPPTLPRRAPRETTALPAAPRPRGQGPGHDICSTDSIAERLHERTCPPTPRPSRPPQPAPCRSPAPEPPGQPGGILLDQGRIKGFAVVDVSVVAGSSVDARDERLEVDSDVRVRVRQRDRQRRQRLPVVRRPDGAI